MSAPATVVRTRTPSAQRKPTVVVVATATPAATAQPAPQTWVDPSGRATPPPTVSAPTPETSPPTPVPAPSQSGAPRTSAPGQGLPASGPKPATQVPVGVQPGPVGAQPGAVEGQPEPEAEQPQPAAGVPQPGVANPPSTRPTPRATPTARPSPSPTTPATQKVAPERSLAGTIKAVIGDGLEVMGVGGHDWHVLPAPGALIRLNGKAARFDSLEAGDTVVILGQAQPGPGSPFLAHAITARRK